jgi:hypothetical protein
MTGGEVVPVAKAAMSVAKKALDDTGEKELLQELASDSPAMKAAAETYARRVAVKQSVLLKVYEPLARFLGVSRAYFDSDFHADMAMKLTDIPDEHLGTPSPSVAIPAMQGLGYSVDEPDLKEMYLNLLATATDTRVKDDAHPSFAEIIKQLSPREAPFLLDALRRRLMPVVRLCRRSEAVIGGETTAANHLVYLVDATTGEPADEPSHPVWVDNWIRLGLVDVDYARELADDSHYDWVQASPVYVRLAKTDPRGKESLIIHKGIVHVTDFGGRFLRAVSFDGVKLNGAPGVDANSAADVPE